MEIADELFECVRPFLEFALKELLISVKVNFREKPYALQRKRVNSFLDPILSIIKRNEMFGLVEICNHGITLPFPMKFARNWQFLLMNYYLWVLVLPNTFIIWKASISVLQEKELTEIYKWNKMVLNFSKSF